MIHSVGDFPRGKREFKVVFLLHFHFIFNNIHRENVSQESTLTETVLNLIIPYRIVMFKLESASLISQKCVQYQNVLFIQ